MIKRLFNNHKKFVYVAVFLIVVLSAVFIARYFFDFDLIMQQLVKVAHIFSSRESLLKFVNSYGSYAEIVYILLQALQVIVAPFPGSLQVQLQAFYLVVCWERCMRPLV
ncbi:MAG: hypothetical protein R3B45_06150 [Bdellovibrionota bacterium]